MTPLFISFDFWNTLATPNSAFAELRTKILKRYSSLETEDQVRAAHKKLKGDFDAYAQKQGLCGFNLTITGALLLTLNANRDPNDDFFLDVNFQPTAVRLHREIQQLALKHPPCITDRTIDMIHTLQSKDIGIGIVSNTNFITGATIRTILNNHALHFDAYTFSDEVGFAKPHPNIFCPIAEITSTREYGQAIHIGDNEICDAGAETLGIQSIIIKNPDDCVDYVNNNILNA